MVIVVVVVVVVVEALSTCRQETLLDMLSLGRAQGSSRPVLRWLGGRQRRPKGGGGCRHLSRGGGGRTTLWEGPPAGVTLDPSIVVGGGHTAL